MASRALISLTLAALIALPAAAQQSKTPAKPAAAAPAAEDPVVARVNGAVLHRSDVLDWQATLPPQYRQAPLDRLYPALIAEMVDATLLAQAARKAKLNDDPGVKRRINLAETQLLGDAYVGTLAKKEITDAKLHARYDQYIKTAPPREEINARHILSASEDDAKAIIAELKKGVDFATLAKEKTTDPAGRTSGGELGWIGREGIPPSFADAAFKLKKGEYTETPVQTPLGWHVIKVEDRRTAKPPTYEEAAPQLARELGQEMVRTKVLELRKEGKIEVLALDGSKPEPGAPSAAAPSAAPPAAAVPTARRAPPPSGGLEAPATAGVPKLAPATAPDQLDQH